MTSDKSSIIHPSSPGGLQRRTLGATGLVVTELCFGALPMGPLQKNLLLEAQAEVVAAALGAGINFVDTAQMYRTYPAVREGIRVAGMRPVVAGKSAVADYDGMAAAIDEALIEMDLDYVDIFLLHAPRIGSEVFEVRAGALRCLADRKKRGLIKAMGLSTHDTRVARLVAGRDDLDVVFPLINKAGMGILAGTLDDMLAAVELCAAAGKGVYLMKVLAGGNLVDDYRAAVDFARGVKGHHSIAIGMVSPAEVVFNVDYFTRPSGAAPTGASGGAAAEGVGGPGATGGTQGAPAPTMQSWSKRFQVFADLCKGCGTCEGACPNGAIAVRAATHRAIIDDERCLTCGYCTTACPEFAIRVV